MKILLMLFAFLIQMPLLQARMVSHMEQTCIVGRFDAKAVRLKCDGIENEISYPRAQLDKKMNAGLREGKIISLLMAVKDSLNYEVWK